MEAGGSSRRSETTSRKRKSAALEGEGSPAPAPAAPAAPDPGAADHDGCGGGRDLHFSDLPDDVLRKIISVLPMKQRGRTQILAKRWLPLWRSLPLNIDCGEIARSNHGKLGDVLQRIISSHQGDCHRFCIRPFLATNMENDAAVDACLLSPALNKLKELEFYRRPWDNWQRVPAPTSIFRFSPTLCVAQFGHCALTDDIVQGLHFPQLKKLGLDYVFLSEFSLSSMIAGSPSLEVLLIIRCSVARCLRINSFTLRSIEVDNSSPDPSMEELIIESAPHLERLFHLDQNEDLHVSVLSAPKFIRLVFGSTDIHQGPRIAIVSLSTALSRIKSLQVCMRTLCLDMVIELMSCFPCMEKLYIQCEKSGTKNLWRRKHRDLLRSFVIRLKK
ncbi:hypothetical protein CFC21_064408 [Triticum aestivum]|uniref:F-box domain-containing protein n=2 Tax=Triticum aestivum TaxID=4565 RepID=A0A3B6KDZ5_WHEAT|nr:F-box protein At4g09920-like [Triticum aestivum]KAF7057076.1 hypothetical protein CFC21_064408 [Triticum aestivum]